ncbi:MAG: photosystem II protein Y [Deltaproteobacteria bacterium]|nr:photosystem II protein Y [Deltaproteobacteria bacterium]
MGVLTTAHSWAAFRILAPARPQ